MTSPFSFYLALMLPSTSFLSQVIDFLSSKAEIQEKRKLARQMHVPRGQSNMSMAAFRQKHKELSTESTTSVDGKHLKMEQGSRRKKSIGKSPTPEVRSRSSTQDDRLSVSSQLRPSPQEVRSRSSTQDDRLSVGSQSRPSPQEVRSRSSTQDDRLSVSSQSRSSPQEVRSRSSTQDDRSQDFSGHQLPSQVK